jgi:acyl-CoA synthetase (AMP-forming)/AMP-acid ligase II
MEWKIVDPETGEPVAFGEPGELCVRGDWLMAAMYKKERGEVFDADGFYHTGDQCVLRQDGYLIYHSRISGMIKTSGANVSPEEVELAIRGLPEVLEAAVVGLPDPKLGQMVAAAVVRLPGSTIDEAAVRAQALSKLSSFKAPKRVFFVATEDLPRTPSNKVKKPALVEMIAEMIARETDAPASAAG